MSSSKRAKTPFVLFTVVLLLLTAFGPTVQAADKVPDLSVSITDSPDPVTAGSNVTYTITVANKDEDAASVTLTNVVTGGTPVSATPTACTTVCNLGTITKSGPGSTVAVSLVVTATTAGTPVTLNSSVSTTGETNTGDNADTESTTVNAAAVLPDVSITKADSIDPATEGTSFTYTLTVANSSATPATDVTVADNLPNTLTFVSATPSSGSCNNNSNLSCNLGTVTQGSPKTVTVTVTPKNSTAGTTISNTASVTATGETATGDNSATETTAVSAASTGGTGGTGGGGNTGDATIVDPANGEPFSSRNNEPHVPCVPFAVEFNGFAANQALNYRIYAQNPTTPNGPATAAQLVPATAITADGTGQVTTGSITLESVLLNNFTRQANQGYHLTLEVDTAAPFDYDSGGGDTKSKTFWMDCFAGNIDVVKAISAGSDQTETFGFTITGPDNFSDTATLGHNQSTATTTPVQSFDPVQGGTYTIVETAETGWNAPQISCVKGPNNTAVTTTSTNGGQGVSFTLLTADVTCTFTNTEATQGNPQTDISVLKIDDEATDPVDEGETFVYTMTVTNNDLDDAAAAVTLSDNLPDNVTYVSHTVDGVNDTAGLCDDDADSNPATDTFTCAFGTMAAGDDFVVAVTVTANVDGTLNNTATVATTTNESTTTNNEDSEVTTVANVVANTSTDVSITKVDDEITDPVDEGENFVYTLTVKNEDTTDSAANVTLSDNLPDNVTYVSHTVDGLFDLLNRCDDDADANPSTDTFTCSFGTMAPGDDFVVAVTVTANVDGTLNNTAVVDTTSVDNNGLNDSDSEQTTVANVPGPSADLSITLSDNPDPVTLGNDVTFRAVITNNGPDTGCGLVVDVPAIEGFTIDLESLQLGETSPDCETGTQLLARRSTDTSTSATRVKLLAVGCAATLPASCNIGSLANGVSTTLTFTATPTQLGTFTTNASILSLSPPDPNLANNRANQTTLVVGPPSVPPPPGGSSADVSISKTDSADPVAVGANYSYTLTVANAGPDAATGVTVADTIPSGLTFVSATSPAAGVTCSTALPTVTCQVGTLAAGQQVQIVIAVVPTAPGLVVNTATVSSQTPDPNPSNNTDTEGTTIGSPAPDDNGTIVVEKQTAPDGATKAFTFTGDLSATLADGDQATLEVAAGTYTVTEMKTDGWSLVRIECVDSDAAGTASSGRIASRTTTFNVDAGETVHCVFTNSKDEVKGGQTDRPDREPDLVKDRVIARSKGKVLPFTGGRPVPLVVLAMTLMVVGLLLAARRPRGRHLTGS